MYQDVRVGRDAHAVGGHHPDVGTGITASGGIQPWEILQISYGHLTQIEGLLPLPWPGSPIYIYYVYVIESNTQFSFVSILNK